MADVGDSRFSHGEWVERTTRVPADRYPELQPFLGWIVITYGVEIDSLTPNETIEEAIVTYNERKVVWVDDPKAEGRRPVIPFARLLEQQDPKRRNLAGRFAGVVRSKVTWALENGKKSDLITFVPVQPKRGSWQTP